MTRSQSATARVALLPLALGAPVALGGCAAFGTMLSPYSESFACKNGDHGQCIDPHRAYADAIAGRTSTSDPAVTRGRSPRGAKGSPRPTAATGDRSPFLDYRDSVYRELQGLVDAPVTPMLRPGQTIRTLILPYATSDRPDRLYMPRYVYTILDRPRWVVGDYLANPASAGHGGVLGQVRDGGDGTDTVPPGAPADPLEPRP